MSVTQATTTPRRQQERRAATRASILKAAGEVFAAQGFHGATLDEVAAAASVSKGAVYYNFASKEDLFLSLLEDRYETRLVEVRKLLAAGTGAKASSAGSSFLDRLRQDPRWAPLFFEFVAYAGRNPATRARFGDWVRQTRAALAELIEARAAQLGVAPALSTAKLAMAVSALANGMLIEALFDPDETPLDAFDDLICLLLTGDTGPRPG